MSNTLKTLAEVPPVTLIENQLVSGARAAQARPRTTPRGVVARLSSLPLCVTPCSILAKAGGSK